MKDAIGIASVRELLGSLIAVPLVALALGSQWSLTSRIDLDFDQSGAAELPRPVDELAFELVADSERVYHVALREDDGFLQTLWTARALGADSGDAARTSPTFRLDSAVRSLQLTALDTGEASGVRSFRALTPRWSLSHRALAALPWAIWWTLWLASRRPASRPTAARALAAWRRADLPVAAAAIYLILFRVAPPGLAGALAGVAIVAAVAALRRAPAATGAVIVAALLCATLGPRVLSALVVSKVSKQFDLTVDHRLKPNGRNINSDGIRFDGEASDVRAEDYVVLFLGDSFTFGTKLRDDVTYPHQFEEFANAPGCNTKVRAINFGWPSASPLLALRQLRQIGAKYQPDLVVYSLDATDFHDDLRYERKLREAGDYEVDSSRIAKQFVARTLPWLETDLAGATGLAHLMRSQPTPIAVRRQGPPEIPFDRFFATNVPLAASRPLIEAGVMKNLAAIQRFAADSLGAPMALVLYPRAYQYSDRESPENWEADEYEPLGPWVREPFRYFAEVAASLPYPVVNLLPAFEISAIFPLYLKDDPHWNRSGARVAGRAVADAFRELGLLPCAPPSA